MCIQACALLQAVSLEAEEHVLQDVATTAANLQAEVFAACIDINVQ